jgi:hypothetical protein
MSDVEECAILYLSERRRLVSFLHTVHGVCEGLYARGSVDGRRETSDGRPLFPAVDRALMEQAWASFKERHGSRGLRLSFKGRRRDELAQAGLVGTGWRHALEDLNCARRAFVRDGEEESLRNLILGINHLLDGLLGVAEAGPVLSDLRELLRDVGGRRFRESSGACRSPTKVGGASAGL